METNAVHPGATAPLPPELGRWNWGAFALTWIWGLAHRTYFALLFFIPLFGWLIVPIVLGLKGNAWAWRNRSWQSVEQFQQVQRRWARYALVAYGCAALIGIALVVTVGIALKRSDAFALANAQLQQDPRVTALIGQPIETGMPRGSISQVGGGSGRAEMDFDVTGPKAAGRAFVTAEKQLGRWAIQRMDLELESGERVTLHDVSSRLAQPAPAAAAIVAPVPASAAPAAPAQEIRADAVLEVTAEATEVQGDLPRKRVEQLIERHRNELRFCFASQRLQTARTTIEFTVLPGGAVETARLESPAALDSQLASCLTGAVGRWTFPAPKRGGTAVVRHTFSVAPRS